MERFRVLIADDHDLVPHQVEEVVSGEFDVAGAVKSGPELLSQIGSVSPDAIVVDISMPGMTGIEVARRLRERGDRTPNRLPIRVC